MKRGAVLTIPERQAIRDNLFKTAEGKPFRWTEWEREVFGAVDNPGVNLVILSTPRGWGKTSLLGVIAGTELLDRDVEIHIGSSDKKQARRVKKYIGKFVSRSMDLSASLDVQRDQVTCPESGSTCMVHEANPSVLGLGGLGRRLLILIDEAAVMSEDVWNYYATAAVKSRSSKIILCSTAGADSSGWFNTLVEEAQADTTGRAVVIHKSGRDLEAPEWVSSGVMKFLAGLIHGSARDRFFYNEPAGSKSLFFTRDQLDGVFTGKVSFRDTCPNDSTAKHYTGIDLAYRRDNAAIVTVGVHSYGVHVEKMKLWKPTRGHDIDLNEIGEYVKELPEQFSRHKFIADPFQCQALLQELGSCGYSVEEFTFSEPSKILLARNFYHAVRDGLFLIPIDAVELRSEMADLVVIEKDYAFTFDHKPRKFSDMSTALALAVMEIPGQAGMRKASRAYTGILKMGGDEPNIFESGPNDDIAIAVKNIAIRLNGTTSAGQRFPRMAYGGDPRKTCAGPPIEGAAERTGTPWGRTF